MKINPSLVVLVLIISRRRAVTENYKFMGKKNPLLIFNFFFLTGLYPLIAWQTGDELVYMAEGAWNETGGIIEWAKEISNFLMKIFLLYNRYSINL